MSLTAIAPGDPPGANDSKPLKVLIVDAFDDAARSMALLLRQCGFAPRVARCGADAVREAEAAPTDIVLTELHLPDVDGCEVVRRIREGAWLKRPLFVAVTTCSRDSDRHRAEAAGIDLLLVRPADPDLLVSLLRRFAGMIG